MSSFTENKNGVGASSNNIVENRNENHNDNKFETTRPENVDSHEVQNLIILLDQIQDNLYKVFKI